MRFPVGSAVTRLSMQETREMWIWSLDGEDPPKEMATHSNVLAWVISSSWVISCSWIISGTEEPGGRQSTGSQRVWQDSLHTRVHARTHTHTHTCEDVNYNFLLKSCWPLGLFFLSTCPSKFFRFPFTHGKAFHWTNHWNLNENSSQVYVVLFLEYPFLWQNLCFPISRQVGSMFSLPNYKSWSWNRVTQIRTRTHSLTLGLRT